MVMKSFNLFILLTSVVIVTGCRNTTDNNSQATATANTANKPIVSQTIVSNLDKAFFACEAQFLDKNQPNISGKLAKNTYPLCFNGFAVMYSGVSKTPIWVAEYLTKERVLQARTLERDDSFHEEKQLPKEVRSTLADYKNSGFSRGHLAPNGDMADKSSQYDSFSLANIAPQYIKHNSPKWSKIENDTRGITFQYGSTYVVTGVAFLGKDIQVLKNNVLIPTHFFKAVYVPKLNQAKVYFSPHNENMQEKAQIISVNDLQKKTGIDAFPSLPNDVKAKIGTFDNDK